MYRIELSRDGQNWTVSYELLSREKAEKQFDIMCKTIGVVTYPYIRLSRIIVEVIEEKKRDNTTGAVVKMDSRLMVR